jgi:hypothetical protein
LPDKKCLFCDDTIWDCLLADRWVAEASARAFPRSYAQSHKSAKKNERENAKVPNANGKKREFALFRPFAAPHRKPVSETKATRKGEKPVVLIIS